MSDFPQTPRGTPLQRPELPRMLPGTRGFVVDQSIMQSVGNAPQVPVRGFVMAAGAAADIGRGIGDVSGAAKDISANIARLRTENDVIEARVASREYESDLAKIMAEEQDESKWPERAAKFISSAEDSWTKRGLSPDAYHIVKGQLREWGSKTLSEIWEASRDQTKRRNIANKKRLVIESADSGDVVSAYGVIDEAVGNNDIPADLGARWKIDIRERTEQKTKERRAELFHSAESAVIAEVEATGLDGTLAKLGKEGFFPGSSAAERERLRNVAQTVAKDRSMSATEEVADLIAQGRMKNPADVDAFASKFLGPSEREEIKVSLLKRQEAGETARLADPDVQWSIYGDALARVNRWNKEASGAEREYFEIHKQAGLLPENLRGEITEPLSRKRSAKPPGPDKVLDDYVSDRLTRLYDRGVFGAFETPEAYNPRTGKFEKAIDPARQDSANRVLAKTKRAMNRWLSENPRASEDMADAQMQRFMAGRVDDEQAAELLEQFNNSASSALFPDPSTTGPTPPDLSAPVSAAEKQTTGKVTKFGWAEDPHLDSNSAKRIAAFSGQDGETAAKKGEDHPNLLKSGDLAVSPDIESELRSEGVEPGDFIRVKLADGTTRVTRWMDRTSDKLTGRWDFYTPDGNDPHDGAAVISFSKIPAPKQ